MKISGISSGVSFNVNVRKIKDNKGKADSGIIFIQPRQGLNKKSRYKLPASDIMVHLYVTLH